MSLDGGDAAPLPCGTKGCEQLSVSIVYWPGQTIRLCGLCTIRAMNVAAHMGFRLQIDLDYGRALEARQ